MKQLSSKQIIFIMAGAMLTLLLAALDNTIVSTAMPKIIRDLHGMEHYAWPFTSYMLCSTIVLPVSGKLADIYGRKKITLIGIAVFVIASALCGQSDSMVELSLLRGLQGIGGGICISSAFIIVSEIFPPKRRGKYMGLIASMFAVASIFGPGAGGLITDNLTWRWIFYVNIPLGVIAFFLIVKFFPVISHAHEQKRRVDIPGLLLFLAAAFPLLFFISQIGNAPLASPRMIILSLFSIVMLTIFLVAENRSKEPLLSLHMFRERVFSSSVIAASLGNLAMFGAIIYLPLYLQSVRGSTATQSGLIMMPMMVSMILSSNIAGVISSRFTVYKPLAVAGISLSAVGMFCFGFLGAHSSLPALILFSGLAGFGIGVTFPVFTVAPQSIFHPRQIGVVTSLVQFFRNLGGTIGTALFGALMLFQMNSALAGVSAGSLPGDIVEAVKNPRILSDEGKLAAVKATLPQSQLGDFASLVNESLRAVGGSIEIIFVIASALLLVSLITVILFFSESQVRQSVEEHRKHY